MKQLMLLTGFYNFLITAPASKIKTGANPGSKYHFLNSIDKYKKKIGQIANLFSHLPVFKSVVC